MLRHPLYQRRLLLDLRPPLHLSLLLRKLRRFMHLQRLLRLPLLRLRPHQKRRQFLRQLLLLHRVLQLQRSQSLRPRQRNAHRLPRRRGNRHPDPSLCLQLHTVSRYVPLLRVIPALRPLSVRSRPVSHGRVSQGVPGLRLALLRDPAPNLNVPCRLVIVVLFRLEIADRCPLAIVVLYLPVIVPAVRVPDSPCAPVNQCVRNRAAPVDKVVLILHVPQDPGSRRSAKSSVWPTTRCSSDRTRALVRANPVDPACFRLRRRTKCRRAPNPANRFTRVVPTQRQRPGVDKREMEGERKLHPTRQRPGAGDRRSVLPVAPPEPRAPRDINITEGITIRELAEKLDVRAKELLKVLLDKGIFASINQALDSPTATQLAESFNGVVTVVSFEDEMMLEVAKEETKENLKPRPPVVTVMGHVDHGKTSLLDAIRSEDVAAGEAGGITQHIGAYKIQVNDRAVVFVDTPGHEAFTRMRARGAKVTDIVVLVVAADDGVMPQTKEAIDHAKAANVPIIVAINKIDKPEAQPERVKRQLSDLGLMPAEWGGDTEFVEVSAKQKKGLDRLLEIILLVADLRELKANPDAPGAGTVLESRVDKGRGPVATILIQNGTFKASDFFICGAVFGKVRALFDDHGRSIKEAGPSTPVEVLGLQGVPEAGDHFQVTDEAKARHIVDYRQGKQRDAQLRASAGGRITLDQLHEQLKTGEVKELGVVIKADVQGTVEVLSEMLPKLSTDQVKLKIIGSGVGAVSENDVLLASASGAIIIAFGVRPERKAADLAQQEGVDIRTHKIIYEVSDEIKKAMEGLLEPVFQESYLGRAEVRNTFRVKGAGTIAGCYVTDGVLNRTAQIRVVRDGVVINTSKLSSLKRFKDDASEVRTGFECGVGISNFNDIKIGDVLEAFSIQKVSGAEAAAAQSGAPPAAKFASASAGACLANPVRSQALVLCTLVRCTSLRCP